MWIPPLDGCGALTIRVMGSVDQYGGRWSGMLTLRRLRKRRKKLSGAFNEQPPRSESTSTGALDSLVLSTSSWSVRSLQGSLRVKGHSRSVTDIKLLATGRRKVSCLLAAQTTGSRPIYSARCQRRLLQFRGRGGGVNELSLLRNNSASRNYNTNMSPRHS